MPALGGSKCLNPQGRPPKKPEREPGALEPDDGNRAERSTPIQ
jgi:hypothetical protein